MRNLRKKEIFKKFKKEELNPNVNSLKRINVNKLNTNVKNRRSIDNTNFPINNNNNKINKTNTINKKPVIQLQTNELIKIIGKINKELYKNKKNYNTSISECINKDYLNLKSINNTSYKMNGESSKNITTNLSQRSINYKPKTFRNDEKNKNNIFLATDTSNIINNNNNNNNNLFANQILIREKSPFIQNNINSINSKNNLNSINNIIPIYKINKNNNPKNLKSKISNFILKNPYKTEYVSINLENENEEEKDNKIINVQKKHKSLKKYNNSQSKFKKKISPFYTDLIIEKNNKNNKNKNVFSNPKNINNMGHFYNYWADNDSHMGGKINLALNNSYRNKIDFYSSLYYIIKIQSRWRGYYLRKSLLKKSSLKTYINIFYRQKSVIKTLFFILTNKFKKDYFKIFKDKINSSDNINNKKEGYDLGSSLLNKVSNCSQNYQNNKGQNLLLYNKKRLNNGRKSIKIENNNKYDSEMNTPKIKRCVTKITNIDKKKENNYSEYKILKTHAISYKSHKKNRENKEENENKKEKEKENNKENDKENAKEKEKENKIIVLKNKSYKRFLCISPDGKVTNQFKINNYKILNKKTNYETIKINKNNENNLINSMDRENTNKLNKYKEYIYFLFLLFARIQRASHRLIFNLLIEKLKEKKSCNIIKIRKTQLLKIIKNIDKKNIKYYFKIYREKILTERIKNIILNKNKNTVKFKLEKNDNNIDNNIKKITNSENKPIQNNNENCFDNNIKKLTNSENKAIQNNNENNNIDNKIKNISNSESKTIQDNNDKNKNRAHSKKHIKIKKINRSTSVNQSLNPINRNYFNYYNSYSNLSKSISVSQKKMIVKQRTKIIQPKNLGEYYEYSPEYLLKKKIDDIFKKMDQKEMKIYFRRWKLQKNKKKKKFLIYFIMLMKEYFCNDISLKSNKEYSIGKCMFYWYRKTFC